uniref:Uncharacterized protein n=1 Tax=Arundo donax TaxID=35708 RepID=A0A0A9EU11_ARUDO
MEITIACLYPVRNTKVSFLNSLLSSSILVFMDMIRSPSIMEHGWGIVRLTCLFT